MSCDAVISKYDSYLSPGSPEKFESNLRKLKSRLHPDHYGNNGIDVEFKEVGHCEDYIRKHYSKPARAASSMRSARASSFVEEMHAREEQVMREIERARRLRDEAIARDEANERVRREREMRQQAIDKRASIFRG